MKLNKRIEQVKPSATLALTSKAKAMRAAGEDVCSFAAGEPDFDTPDFIKTGAMRALLDGQTKYCPSSGVPALREMVAKKLQDENGLSYKPSQIVIGNGAKHSLFSVIMAVCDDDDEVLIPTPAWLSYPEMVSMAGARSVCIETRQEDSFALRPEALRAAITPKTRAIILNSPSNPTGMVYSRSELEALAEVIVEHDLLVIADEIYETMVYDGAEHVSIGSLSDEILARTVTINGFSKAYSMTGWRLGYFAAPEEISKAVISMQSHSTSGPNTFAQYGAMQALQGPPSDSTWSMLPAFTERRNRIYELLNAMPGVSILKPMGAFYMFPNISKLGLSPSEFASRLLEEEKVAVVPGEPFGTDKHVRLSYACSMENIEKGLERMKHFVERLQA